MNKCPDKSKSQIITKWKFKRKESLKSISTLILNTFLSKRSYQLFSIKLWKRLILDQKSCQVMSELNKAKLKLFQVRLSQQKAMPKLQWDFHKLLLLECKLLRFKHLCNLIKQLLMFNKRERHHHLNINPLFNINNNVHSLQFLIKLYNNHK